MKATALYTTFLAALATHAGTASAATCKGDLSGTDFGWTVEADGLTDGTDGVCGGLWDNLKGYPGCTASGTSCDNGGKDGHIKWSFHVPTYCGGDKIETIWYSATKNAWGTIDCP